jgi:hypothetical protein
MDYTALEALLDSKFTHWELVEAPSSSNATYRFTGEGVDEAHSRYLSEWLVRGCRQEGDNHSYWYPRLLALGPVGSVDIKAPLVNISFGPIPDGAVDFRTLPDITP